MKIYVFPLLVILFLSGCAQWSTSDMGTNNHYIKLDAKNRGIVILKNVDENNVSKYNICAEPFPDAITGVSADISGNYKDINATIGLQQNIVNIYASLKTERILEKSLYRLCELSVNSDLNATDIKEMYITVLNVAQALAQIELTNAQTKKAETVNKILTNKDIEPTDKKKIFEYLYKNNIYPTIFDQYGNPQSPVINFVPKK